jgi:F420H(2)-dependent quinone reductase
MQRNSKMSLLVVDPDDASRYLQIRGDAELVERGALGHLDRLTRKYMRHPHYYGYIYPREQQARETARHVSDSRVRNHLRCDPSVKDNPMTLTPVVSIPAEAPPSQPAVAPEALPTPPTRTRSRRPVLLKWFFRVPVGQYYVGLANQLGRSTLLLATRGRKTGRLRTTALNYFVENDLAYVVSGSGAGSDWLRNL